MYAHSHLQPVELAVLPGCRDRNPLAHDGRAEVVGVATVVDLHLESRISYELRNVLNKFVYNQRATIILRIDGRPPVVHDLIRDIICIQAL